MKKTILSIFAMLALSAAAFAQVAPGQYSITSIKTQFVQTPKFTYSPPVPQMRPDTRNWLMIQVQFKAEPESTSELQVSYYVAMSDGNMYTGNVTYQNIAGGPKVGALYSSIFMSPDFLAKIATVTKRPVTANDVKNVYVQITKPGISAPLAAKVEKQGGTSGWWNQMKQVQGYLVNKSETPWGPISWIGYLSIKSSATH